MSRIGNLTINEIETLLRGMELANTKLEQENTTLKRELKDAKRQREIYRENLLAKMNGQSEMIEGLRMQVAQLAFKTVKV